MIDIGAMVWFIVWIVIGLAGLALIFYVSAAFSFAAFATDSPGLGLGAAGAGIILWIGWLILAVFQVTIHLNTLINGG